MHCYVSNFGGGGGEKGFIDIIPVSVYSRAEGCMEFGRALGAFFFLNHKSYGYFS